MIILIPPTYNKRDGQQWAKASCCGNYAELHAFAAQHGIDRKFFDDKFVIECQLLDGRWKYQDTVQLRAAYWLNTAQYARLERLCLARLWMGNSRKYELYEYGNYSDPTGLNFIPQRNPPVRVSSGVAGCSTLYPPDPELAAQNAREWNESAECKRLAASIDRWIADNLSLDNDEWAPKSKAEDLNDELDLSDVEAGTFVLLE